MVGKNPHRPEGKVPDNERLASVRRPVAPPLDKAAHDRDLEEMQRRGGPTSTPAFEQRGGSRPGVRSRIEEAEERMIEREGE